MSIKQKCVHQEPCEVDSVDECMDDCRFYKPDNIDDMLRTLARIAVELDPCDICPVRSTCPIDGREGEHDCENSLIKYAKENPTKES